jgi:thioesterase domain-containing protein
MPASMTEAATEVLEAIIERQQEPPHILLGFSWGGILAYEVAVQGSRECRRPPVVILLDAVAPVPQLRPLDILLHMVRSVPGWAIRSGPRGWIRVINRLLARRQPRPSGHQAGAGTSRPVVDHFLALANDYVASKAPQLEIHLIRATASLAGITPLNIREIQTLWDDYGWRRTSGARVHVHRIPCRGHEDLLREPWCADVAAVISRLVEVGE